MNIINWDQYFMSVAILSSYRSKDPSTKVGSCIINNKKRIISCGYNGFPNNCNDELLPWKKEGDELETKYFYVCHAELNAIINSNIKLNNCTLYTTLFPCNECTKLIIQSNIKKIIYLSDKHKNLKSTIASKKMLILAGIIFEEYVNKKDNIIIDFNLY